MYAGDILATEHHDINSQYQLHHEQPPSKLLPLM